MKHNKLTPIALTVGLLFSGTLYAADAAETAANPAEQSARSNRSK